MITMDKFSERNNTIAKSLMAEWKETKRYTIRPSKKPKYFITFPFPYVNGAPHVGHAYSILRVDSYAKFKRLQGHNVLFPLGFHATGEPIVGVIERLKKKDESQKKTLKLFGATEKDIESFVKDPKNLVLFWVKRWKEDVERAGCSVDWERTFITAGFSNGFSRFIEWQYKKLHDKGYIKQGTHPVIWCPHDKSPTGDHDRLVGEGESPQEYDIILFESEGKHLACATLRPETIYEATNIWVNKGEYAIAEVDGKEWILSESAIKKMEDQLHGIRKIRAIKSEELTKMKAANPLTGKKLPIFESEFVDMEHATGIVMSVPGHAPYDYIALTDMIKKGDKEAKEALQNARNMIMITGVPKGVLNAAHYSAKHKAHSISDKEALEKATSDLYKTEFHKGKFITEEFEGMTAEIAKKKTIERLHEKGMSSSIYEMTGDVVCRCTTRCHVKILENQWFIDYKDEEWKKVSKEHLESMTIEPEIARTQFHNTIDWLEYKACARKSGFGTKLPFDNEWIVETLSDSTIYNAYYTISRYINEGRITEDELTDEAFDYIFLGEGIASGILDEMKEEFEHFYPVDMRGSGKDLIQNHLTFFIMQHVAIFKKKHWPRGISVNGYVNVEGEKMAKSKGNVIPLRELMEKHGPDLVRIGIVASTEGMDDANWSENGLSGYESRLNHIANMIEKSHTDSHFKISDTNIQDRMLLHVLENVKRSAYAHYDQLRFRSAAHESFFTLSNSIRNYSKYTLKKEVINHVTKEFLVMNSPLMPYSAEQLYKEMTGESILDALWPHETTYNFSHMNEKIGLHESLKQDISAVISLIEKKGGKARAIKIVMAEPWAYIMLSMKDQPLSEMMKNETIRMHGQIASKAYPKIRTMKWNLNLEEEKEAIMELKGLLEKDFDMPITILDESSEKKGLPGKPGIIIE
jgi:leucyl-tRNA synthetase